MQTVDCVERSGAPEQTGPQEWFASWFDTEHYQRLYANRDDLEAGRFVDRLVRRLGVPSGASVLDLCCGNGRHAARLAARGFRVTGIDLSAASLALARARVHQPVRWTRQDMRCPFGEGAYDYIMNLFTSFGYFETAADHVSVVRNIARALKPGGRAVIDFLNVTRAEARLRPYEVVRRGSIAYRITRWTDRKAILKRIVVDDERSGPRTFVERVAKLTRNDFVSLFGQCGLELECTYGDYALAPFDAHRSERLILVARRAAAHNALAA